MSARKLSIAAGLLVAGLSLTPGQGVQARPISIDPMLRDPARLRTTMLGWHNAARQAAGVGPVVWDDQLAASARAYAQQMARTGRFAHADQSRGLRPQGENLWAGTRGAYSYAEMVRMWVDESRDFVNAPTPQFSRTGRWEDVGHYSQIVWRGSTAVGCALASNASEDYLVCRYDPAGNVFGRRAI